MANDNSKNIKLTILGIFFLFIVAYGFLRSTDLLFGVKIRRVSLGGAAAESGAVVKESATKITGTAKNAVKLILNGREISVDLLGNFEETIALLPGYNIISIRAADKFGYVDEKNYKLILTQALGD